MNIKLQIYDNEEAVWLDAGSIELGSDTWMSQKKSSFTYNVDYITNLLSRFQDFSNFPSIVKASHNHRIIYGETHRSEGWPSFTLDLVPQGAARKYWISVLGAVDSKKIDSSLLLFGGTNSPGNVRVQPQQKDVKKNFSQHPQLLSQIASLNHTREWHSTGKPAANSGFDKQEILNKGPDFLDYASRLGAPVSGATGNQGMSPKYLIRESDDGQWYADLELPDHITKACYLVKFPKHKSPIEELIVEGERSFLQIAKILDLKTHGEPRIINGALIVDRFDRNRKGNRIERFGLESLASVHNLLNFDFVPRMEDLALTVVQTSGKPTEDICEFFIRDALSIVLGNTDNHARNTAFIKKTTGEIELSPVFDFAPMYLDPEGIARVFRFSSEYRSSDKGGLDFPNYISEIDALKERADTVCWNPEQSKNLLKLYFNKFFELEKIMSEVSVPKKIQLERVPRLHSFLKWLERTL